MERTANGATSFQVKYHWHRVSERTDGSALGNLAGYEVYTAASLLTPKDQWTLLTTVTTEEWDTIASQDAVNYYCFRAIDTGGLRSDWTQVVDDSVDLNHFFIYTDNVSRVQLPMVAANC